MSHLLARQMRPSGARHCVRLLGHCRPSKDSIFEYSSVVVQSSLVPRLIKDQFGIELSAGRLLAIGPRAAAPSLSKVNSYV
jgi:hypothetical protein